MTKEKIGFIGLRIMGKHMSKNLLRAGYSLVVYDLRPEPVEEPGRRAIDRHPNQPVLGE